MPLKSDSLRSAWYAGATVSLGGANEEHDGLYAFNASLYRTNSFGSFEAYYGTGFTAGDYDISAPFEFFTNSLDTTYFALLSKQAGEKFYGGLGLYGGISFVKPMDDYGSEWRMIGLESSVQHEFGGYRNFRKNLPDSIASSLMRSAFYSSVGVSTEFIFKKRKDGTPSGFKIGYGVSLQPTRNFVYDGNSHYVYRSVYPFYFSAAFHFTKKHWTFFWQFNSGYKAINIQMGTTYRITQKRHAG